MEAGTANRSTRMKVSSDGIVSRVENVCSLHRQIWKLNYMLLKITRTLPALLIIRPHTQQQINHRFVSLMNADNI